MDMTGHVDRAAEIQWASDLADQVRLRDAQAAQEIDDTIDRYQTAQFQIAVLGKAKRGKSTLINALLGRHDDVVAPIDKLPASSCVTRFTWAEAEAAGVSFRDGRRQAIAYDQIRQYVTEEFNRENNKGVTVVDVAGPFSGLDHDVMLVDTPGAASIHEHHDALLHAFIPRADAVIFLVTARMPLDQDELELLKQVKAADTRKVFFAINRVDEAEEEDLNNAIQHNQTLLSQAGIPVETIHRISARSAFRGDPDSSGVPALLDEIGGFLAENKIRVMSARFVHQVHAIAEPVLRNVELEMAGRQKTTEQLNAELQTLRQKQESISTERQFAEREFTNAWSRAVDEFEQSLKSSEREASSEIVNQIASTAVMDVSAMAKRLPTELNHLIENKLAPATGLFEQNARQACDKLQSSYPSMSMGESGSIVIRTRQGNECIIGSAGGAAAAAAGVGLAAAGSAAAAASAAAATAMTITVPTALSTILPGLGATIGTYFGVPTIGGAAGTALGSLATGTAVVTAPAAAAPLWVVLAGPVGWTLAGLGVLAVPFSWRLSKVRLRNKLEDLSRQQVEEVFKQLREDRIPQLRKMGLAIVEDFNLRLDRQISQIETSLTAARDHRDDGATATQLNSLAESLREHLDKSPTAQANAVSSGSS